MRQYKVVTMRGPEEVQSKSRTVEAESFDDAIRQAFPNLNHYHLTTPINNKVRVYHPLTYVVTVTLLE